MILQIGVNQKDIKLIEPTLAQIDRADNLLLITKGISKLLSTRSAQLKLIETYGTDGKVFILIKEIETDDFIQVDITQQFSLEATKRDSLVSEISGTILYQKGNR